MYCSQKLGEDFAKLCGLLRIYELYDEITLGSIQVLRHQRGGWVGSENGNF